MRLKSIILVLFYLSLVNTLFAQGIKIKGKVLDEKKEPLIGVSVVENGNAKNGTTTDLNGSFQLTVKNENAVLSFSFIGYFDLYCGLRNQYWFVC